MSDNLKIVSDKARADTSFAKELFSDPVAACKAAGIELNRTEIKIIVDAMKDVRDYFYEKLHLTLIPPDVLHNKQCDHCQS
jgi:hypothetical protein